MEEDRTAQTANTSVTIRDGTIEDTRLAFEVFQDAIIDLGDRIGVETITGGGDPQVRDSLWQRRQSLMQHLTTTAKTFALAETDGQIVGYARSLVRDGVRQLSDFFVEPGYQSGGVGRALLEAVFPINRAEKRIIIATTDTRALVRYLKSGVYPRFPIHYFSKRAQLRFYETDLSFEPITQTDEILEALNLIDREIIGYTRAIDHLWLMHNRQGFVYKRANAPVGYGYISSSSGPFALLDSDDYPAVLAHGESLRAEQNGSFGVEVPLINHKAVDYVLANGFQMDAFYCHFMSNEPFGRYENYLATSPTFFT